MLMAGLGILQSLQPEYYFRLKVVALQAYQSDTQENPSPLILDLPFKVLTYFTLSSSKI